MESPMILKSPPGRIALRRKENMSQKRPAAGGESCKAGFFLVATKKESLYNDS